MPVKINISPTKIQVKVDNAWRNGLDMLSTEILADCNEYCKYDQGNLIMSSWVHSQLDKGILIWDTPYAKRQYYEIKTSLTPGRTWKWCETAKKRWLSSWNRLAEKAVKMNL